MPPSPRRSTPGAVPLQSGKSNPAILTPLTPPLPPSATPTATALTPTLDRGLTHGHADNSINGTPSCANPELLTTILRDTWNFTKPENFVVGDCGAVNNIAAAHHFAKNGSLAVTDALTAGVDWDCYGTKDPYGNAYVNAVTDGFLPTQTLDRVSCSTVDIQPTCIGHFRADWLPLRPWSWPTRRIWHGCWLRPACPGSQVGRS